MPLTRQILAERLKKARESLGLTQAEAAEKAGMTRIALNQVEQAKRNLDTLEMSALARAYRLPLADLFGEEEALEPLQVLFRAADAVLAIGGTRDAVSEAYGLFREISYLQGKLAKGRAQTPPSYELELPRSKEMAIQEGESVAQQERKRLELGSNALWDVAEVIRREGVLAAQMSLPKEVSGFTLFHGQDPLMVVNGAHLSVRRLFSLAHEYGHVRMDRRQQAVVSAKAEENGFGEVRANAFAAALLLPSAGVRAFVERQNTPKLGWSEVAELAGEFGVAYATAVYRLLNLRHINKDAAQVLLTQQKQADEFFKKLRRDRPAVEQGSESLSSQLVEWALKALKADMISRKKALELAGKARWKASEFEKWAKAMGWERSALRGPQRARAPQGRLS